MRPKDPFDALLQRHRGLLYTLCRGFSRRSNDFDDLLQEATLALWRARELLMAQPSAVQQAALVWKIGRNAIIDALRRTHPSDPLPEGYDRPAEENALVDELYEQIACLEEPDKSIVRLQLQGYSYAEIAEELHLSEKNVSVRLVRVKERLREMMGIENKKKRD